MKTLVVIIGLVALSHARNLLEPVGNPRIVNGEDAEIEEFPYQISLQNVANDFHFCGGSILNEKYVITAAHCLLGTSASAIKVIASTVKLSSPGQSYLVEEVIIHAGFDLTPGSDDIALLKVKEKFVVTSALNFIGIPEDDFVIPGGTPATVTGWGSNRLGSKPDHLQKADIVISDQQYCQSRYPQGIIHDTKICAHDPLKPKGACNGDSGGPLTVNGTLVGIVSGSMFCALPEYPTVHTRVSKYLDWIKNHAV